MNPVRVAVIGVGYLGKFHAEKYAKLPDVELVGVVDSNGDTAREVSRKLGVPCYTTHEHLDGKVDAVSIVVPTNLHHTIARWCLIHGIDVLVEKPIAATLEEADDLVETAGTHRRVLQVGHLERFNAAVAGLRGVLTTPLFIESHRLAPFKERGTEVDVILDIMIHDIDIILSMVGAPVTAIHAVGVPVISADKNDIANVRLEFATGCIANITASRISIKEMRKVRVFQPDTYISIDFAARQTEVYKKISSGAGSDGPQITYEQVAVDQADALEREIQAFIQCVMSRCEPEVSGREGRDALKIALDIVEQVEAKKSALHIA